VYDVPGEVVEALMGCDEKSKETIGFISKMFSIAKSELPGNKRVQLTAEELRALRQRKKEELLNPNLTNQPTAPEWDDPVKEEDEQTEALIGFARLYSGTLRPGDEVYNLGPKFNSLFPEQHSTKFTVQALYQLMGRDVLPLTQVKAGKQILIKVNYRNGVWYRWFRPDPP
jgi:ribosome assembly protein 1